MRSGRLSEIRSLDPERDHVRIVHLMLCYEFPWDITRALELALFRTYCVPSISGLLDRTGEFRQRPQKRYDDTDLIVSLLLEEGYDSEPGRAALARMNAIHGRFSIANDDFLYVLSTFVFEPLRWLQRFGWREPSRTEQLALFYFWREVGRRMGIRDIPDRFEDFERFNQEYERNQVRYADSNRRVGEATRELFASWFPAWLRPMVRRGIHALLDPASRAAFGFPTPSPTLVYLSHGILRLRGRLLRWWPARRRPRWRTRMPHRSYPGGWSLEDLGPPWMQKRPPVTQTTDSVLTTTRNRP